MKMPKVVYEDNHLLVINKPSGWLVQGDKTGDETLTDWGKSYIKANYNKPGAVFLHPAHRLDRPVTGLVIFGRTSKGTERMNKLFREDRVEKTYLAIVQGTPDPPQSRLTHWLIKDERRNITKAYRQARDNAKRAELTYQMLAETGILSLLEIKPKTGRPHQIRVQLASIGCSIRGDLKYGYPDPNPDKSISLHAFHLRFEHPVKKEVIKLACMPPQDNWSEFTEIIHGLDRAI